MVLVVDKYNSMVQLSWRDHLSKFRRDNPNYKGNVMQAASATYKQAPTPPTYPVNLTSFIESKILGNFKDRYQIAGTKTRREAENLKGQIDTFDKQDANALVDILSELIDLPFFSDKNCTYLLNIIRENDYNLVRELIDAYHADGGKNYTAPLVFID